MLDNRISSGETAVFECSIRITRQNEDFYQIRNSLEKGLLRLYRAEFDPQYDLKRYSGNLIYNSVSRMFYQRFVLLGNTSAYLTNYIERPGSLEITFSIIFLLVSNYGSLRESVDYFMDDTKRLFEFVLSDESGYSVNTNSHARSNNVSTLGHDTSNTTERNILKKIAIGLPIFLFLTALLIFNYQFERMEENIISDDNVKKIIREEMKNERIEQLLNKRSDTLLVKIR